MNEEDWFGFDNDNRKTIKETVQFAKKMKLMSSQFLILTPLPGTDLYHQLSSEKRICFKDWNLYDAHHVVFKPRQFSLMDLQRAQINSHRNFYSRKESLLKLFKWKWIDIGIAHYARQLNRLWKKKNRTYLKAVDLMTPRKGTTITIDYKEDVLLEDTRAVA